MRFDPSIVTVKQSSIVMSVMSDFLLNFELTHSKTSILRTWKEQSLVSLEPSELSITERGVFRITDKCAKRGLAA